MADGRPSGKEGGEGAEIGYKRITRNSGNAQAILLIFPNASFSRFLASVILSSMKVGISDESPEFISPISS